MVRLTPERKERVTSQLQKEGFELAEVRKNVLRAFPDIHLMEKSDHRGDFADRIRGKGGGKEGKARPSFRRPGQVNVAEEESEHDDDEYGEGADEGHDPEHEINVADVENTIRDELEALATEIEDGNAAGLDEEDALRLDQAAIALGDVREALATVREVRGRMPRKTPPATDPKRGKGGN